MEDCWYLYVLRCADETLYTGVTTDPERRLHEHNNTKAGAKYTRGRRPVELIETEAFESKSEALSAESHFKQLSRPQKLESIDSPDEGALLQQDS